MKEYLPYIDQTLANELIKNTANELIHNRRGTNSKAFIIGDYCVLKSHNIPLKENSINGSPFNIVIDKLHTLKQSGVNVVPILGYMYDEKSVSDSSSSVYTSGYIFQPKAPGSELWDSKKLSMYNPTDTSIDYLITNIQTLANAPNSHYAKFVSDFKKIDESGIQIDPSKKENFFYDPEVGFSFIDLNFLHKDTNYFNKPDLNGNANHNYFIRYCFSPCINYLASATISMLNNEEKDVIANNNKLIFNKISNALLKVGISKQEIQNIFEDSSSESSYMAGISIYGINPKNDFNNLSSDAEINF